MTSVHISSQQVETLPTADLLTLIFYGERQTKKREQTHERIQQFLADRLDDTNLLGIDLHEMLGSQHDLSLAYRMAGLMELNRRLTRPHDPLPQINAPGDAARIVMPLMRSLTQEHLRVLVLDTKRRLAANHLLYQGTLDTTAIRVAEVFRPALVRNCSAIMVCHNHPSGDPEPSQADLEMTKKIRDAGRQLDIELVDHLVIGDGRYTSIRQRLYW